MAAPVPDTTPLCLRAKIEEVFEFTTEQCIELLTLAQAARQSGDGDVNTLDYNFILQLGVGRHDLDTARAVMVEVGAHQIGRAAVMQGENVVHAAVTAMLLPAIAAMNPQPSWPQLAAKLCAVVRWAFSVDAAVTAHQAAIAARGTTADLGALAREIALGRDGHADEEAATRTSDLLPTSALARRLSDQEIRVIRGFLCRASLPQASRIAQEALRRYMVARVDIVGVCVALNHSAVAREGTEPRWPSNAKKPWYKYHSLEGDEAGVPALMLPQLAESDYHSARARGQTRDSPCVGCEAACERAPPHAPSCPRI